MDNRLTYLQLQLVEYGYQCLHEIYRLETKSNELKVPELVIQSDDDIFKASTLPTNENGRLNFKVSDDSLLDRYREHTFYMGNDHPFQEIRSKIFTTFYESRFLPACRHALKNPNVSIDQIIRFVKSIDIQYDFDMPKVWYNYQSLKYPTLSLDFKIADDVEYHLVSIC